MGVKINVKQLYLCVVALRAKQVSKCAASIMNGIQWVRSVPESRPTDLMAARARPLEPAREAEGVNRTPNR